MKQFVLPLSAELITTSDAEFVAARAWHATNIAITAAGNIDFIFIFSSDFLPETLGFASWCPCGG
jgi:hypothetical protein